jgi:hypothetical protein
MKFSYNQLITFKLDGHWYGNGRIKVINSHSVEVELTNPCKEFPKGTMLIVDNSEVVLDYDPVDYFM